MKKKKVYLMFKKDFERLGFKNVIQSKWPIDVMNGVVYQASCLQFDGIAQMMNDKRFQDTLSGVLWICKNNKRGSYEIVKRVGKTTKIIVRLMFPVRGEI